MLLTLASYIGVLALGIAAGGYAVCYYFVDKGYITLKDHNNTIEEVTRCLRLQ